MMYNPFLTDGGIMKQRKIVKFSIKMVNHASVALFVARVIS